MDDNLIRSIKKEQEAFPGGGQIIDAKVVDRRGPSAGGLANAPHASASVVVAAALKILACVFIVTSLIAVMKLRCLI